MRGGFGARTHGGRATTARAALAGALALGLALLAGATLAAAARDAAPAPGDGRPLVLRLAFDGPIGPAARRYVDAGLARAERDGADAVLLLLDTPGGLDVSMRAIVKAVLASTRPVIVFVHPPGARAASAGTFIAYAAHVAAMAPGTNLGAATPVRLGGGDAPDPPPAPRDGDAPATPGTADGASDDDRGGAGRDGTGGAGDAERDGAPSDAPDAMTRKVTNDAVAYLRSLAELRGRDADWAEAAVRDAASLPAREALARGVVDVVARDPAELLERVSGRVVRVGDADVALELADARVEAFDPDWRIALLGVLTNPNVALLLVAIGFYGIVIEFFGPGALLPGTVGAVSLPLGLYGLAVLPFDLAGVALLLLGLALLVGEAFVPSFGVLGVGGLVALWLGADVLGDVDAPGFALAWPLLAGVAVAGLAATLLVARLALSSRRRRVVTGRRGLIGKPATVDDWAGGRGHVFCDGERWTAVSDDAHAAGAAARVVAVTGNTLTISAAPAAGPPEPDPPR